MIEGHYITLRSHCDWIGRALARHCRKNNINQSETLRTHLIALPANYFNNFPNRDHVSYKDLMTLIYLMDRLGLTTEDLVKYHGEEYQREKRVRKAKNVDK